jgi:muramidase (phage lysozyme)
MFDMKGLLAKVLNGEKIDLPNNAQLMRQTLIQQGVLPANAQPMGVQPSGQAEGEAMVSAAADVKPAQAQSQSGGGSVTGLLSGLLGKGMSSTPSTPPVATPSPTTPFSLQGEQGTLRGFLNSALGQKTSTPNPQVASLGGSVSMPQSPTTALPQSSALPVTAPQAIPAPVARSSGREYEGIGDPAAEHLPPHVKAFLNATSAGESNGQYNVRYTPRGGARFDDMSKHPGVYEPGPSGPSSAAGRYQFVKSTWDRLGGGPMDPAHQDVQAWNLAQQDYKARTGRSLDTDLQEKGLTPEIQKTLAPTWSAFKGKNDVWQRVYERDLKKYSGSGDVETDTQDPSRATDFSSQTKGAKVYNMDKMGKSGYDEWNDSWEQAVEHGGKPEEKMKEFPGYEGALKGDLLFVRKPRETQPTPPMMLEEVPPGMEKAHEGEINVANALRKVTETGKGYRVNWEGQRMSDNIEDERDPIAAMAPNLARAIKDHDYKSRMDNNLYHGYAVERKPVAGSEHESLIQGADVHLKRLQDINTKSEDIDALMDRILQEHDRKMKRVPSAKK